MSTLPMTKKLKSFYDWRQRAAKELQNVIKLTSAMDIVPSGTLLKMEMRVAEIQRASLQVAFVGEFSRGKSELINALLCMGEKQNDATPTEYRRLLPSSAGQTTMCPLEIKGAYDEDALGRDTLRLLPITTRSMDASMEMLKANKSAWHNFSWVKGDWKERKEAMARMAETICVDLADARKLGLCPPLNQTPKGLERTVCPSCGLGKVLIPRWRYAIARVDHPLLNAGLTLLDTPGLNALGAEPELTLQVLKGVDAVLFVLRMDTGVTQMDLNLWENYVRQGNQQQLILLNKIDALWDELSDDTAIQEEISEQIQKTASQLQVDPFQIIPITGQKGLLAKIKKDPQLLEKSGLPALEQEMADLLVPAQYTAIKGMVEKMINGVMPDQEAKLKQNRQQMEAQMQSMARQQEQAKEKVPKLIAQHQTVLQRFQNDKSQFEAKNARFREAVDKHLLIPLSPHDFEVIIENAQKEMLASWTTGGIVERFRKFFDEAVAHFDRALAGAEKVSKLFMQEYQSLQAHYALPDLQMVPYAIMPRRSELLEMATNYERFGKTMEMAASTKNTIVRKMFLDVATRTRDFVLETHKDAQAWVDDMIGVFQQQLNDFEKHVQQELQSLEQLEKAMEQMESRVSQMRQGLRELQESEEQMQEALSKLVKAIESA